MERDALPFFSIMIPTHNRQALLETCLESLKHMDYPSDRFEVIVIDDGSTDGTRDMIHRIEQDVPYSLVYETQPNRGIPCARNRAMDRARGDIFLFTDDDCFFNREWLSQLVGHFEMPRVGAVGMPDKNPEDGSLFSKCADYTINSLIGAGSVRRKEGVRMAVYYPRGFGMAVPRQVIEEIGGFDETLAAGEDIDLSYRIKEAGYTLQYEPRAFVWHQRRTTFMHFLKQMATRGFTRVELVQRHRGLMEISYFLPLMMVLAFILLLLFSFVSSGMLTVFVVTIILYLSIAMIAGIQGALKLKETKAVLIIPCLVTLQHLMYGLGTLKALFERFIMRKERFKKVQPL